jgi:dienelactone hydrolase
MRISKYILVFLVIVVLLFGLTACPVLPGENVNVDNAYSDTSDEDDEDADVEGLDDLEDNEGDTEGDEDDMEDTEEEESSDPDFEPLPAEPQSVEIETDDSRILEGLYYAPKVGGAPVVVMMHWAGGSMEEDWHELAPWLQNRQDELESGKRGQGLARPPYLMPWQDPSWFPVLPTDVSFAVLVFNFGSWGNSQPGELPESWLDDALAAIKYAAALTGIDPNRISTIGASIGADAAAEACFVFNLEALGRCIAAFSLSPGEYLNFPDKYAGAVEGLDADGYPAWCLAARDDATSYETCQSAMGTNYKTFTFDGGDHGMMLVTPNHMPSDPKMDVNTLELYLQFLEEVYGLELIS